ncbi:hypothetical protein [Phreatobacter stygius]|uniref:Lectin-like protein BA14k n=1 Tax=Phreatobacter stygius TaxID=1940610 RepID=A0A4D7BB92_9HYPH|nr:hypothetical protein [Phreatobacter stygius]QCI67923.1 hypothetical protein E8M01_29040 [Phreatobacter stygius]
MPIMMNTRPVVTATIGALALGFVLAMPTSDARAGEQTRDRTATGSTADQAPVEMQRRGFGGGGRGFAGGGRGFGGGQGFAGRGIRPGAFTGVGPGGFAVRPGGGGWGGRPGGYYRPGWHGGYRYGGWYGPGPWAGAAAAGLILGGAAIASSPYYYDDCWIERRWVTRWDGYAVPRDVRVCR